MPISTSIERVPISELKLDAKNPRLGRHFSESGPSQEQILSAMGNWTLDELAVSFLESGFWTQEALVIVEENGQLVVVEGNRRLAALKLISMAWRQEPVPRNWGDLVADIAEERLEELSSVPCVRADSRQEVQAYLGFRHVSGIKEWAPAEKAQFIAHLVEHEDLSYEQVMRRIGSKTPTVRQNYISYRILLQMENEIEGVSIRHVESRFSVLYLSLRSAGTQHFLEIDVAAAPDAARQPVPESHLANLKEFALWLFGTEEHGPIVKDSRDIDAFGRILESSEAVDYLRRADSPSFNVAYRIAGGEETEVAEHIDRAADEVEEALGAVHRHRSSARVRGACRRLGQDVVRLLEVFPDLRTEILEG